MNNIFAPSWYVFDKIYPNKKEMDDKYSSDGVALGRYVLVRYSEYNFTEAEKELLIKGLKHNYHIQDIGNEWDAYVAVYNTSQARIDFYNNAVQDISIKYNVKNGQAGPESDWKKNLRDCYDRIFFRKGPNGYEEMDSLVIPEDLKELGDRQDSVEASFQVLQETVEVINDKLAAMVETF